MIPSPPSTGADGLAIVTEWNQFRGVDFATLKDRLKTPVVFDGRNLFDPRQVSANGLTYYSIGRTPTTPG
jgi:UDPglucose 6-dehydrogenase